jgi:hypothetical protein
LPQLHESTDESEVPPEHSAGNAARNAASLAQDDGPDSPDDGPEFSSDPMPAAYGAFYSAAAGLLILVILFVIF